MDEVPQRIDPATDRTVAALLLGCAPDEVGYCPRCQGLTHRYGRNAQIICPACRSVDASLGAPFPTTAPAPQNSPSR
ncbi:hypothetical protein SSP24_64480 [Streptomyces spinoverrucosus]|uniref:Uncharacterized protein n=1 Tax=Streptomyces spinoverrucosus TaxID=284043 RepID=A0A4Y3VQC6_9ACTN|nr:hypothetical protein SSP24_64480 [Streptomyces spinoverrucosus]GHB88859.1 hypothetical protein GCM10010397_71010 [Streptomyces spinoverrucosus]